MGSRPLARASLRGRTCDAHLYQHRIHVHSRKKADIVYSTCSRCELRTSVSPCCKLGHGGNAGRAAALATNNLYIRNMPRCYNFRFGESSRMTGSTVSHLAASHATLAHISPQEEYRTRQHKATSHLPLLAKPQRRQQAAWGLSMHGGQPAAACCQHGCARHRQ